MAMIRKRITKDGLEKYHVSIRRKTFNICKSFSRLEDAELYAKWKEDLIDNMDNFEVKINETITLSALIDIKIDSLGDSSKKTMNDMRNIRKTTLERFGESKIASEITFEDWKNLAKSLYSRDVFRGAKSGNNIRKMSVTTLRNFFAYISSCYSFAQSKGIEIENLPLKVIQTFIRPLKDASETSLVSLNN